MQLHSTYRDRCFQVPNVVRYRFASSPLWALTLSLVASAASASTFTVTNLADSGEGSLRQAILDAIAKPGADQVEFAPGVSGVLSLMTNLRIEGVLDIIGPGADQVEIVANCDSGGCSNSRPYSTNVINGTGAFTVVNGATASISGLSITNGYFGVQNSNSTLIVSGCNIYQNYSHGIYSSGSAADLAVVDSYLAENVGDGIYQNGGRLDVNGATITANEKAGINNDGVTASIRDSELSGNRNRGIKSLYGALEMDGVSVIGNATSESDGGGGLYSNYSGDLKIRNSTFASNKAQSGCGGGANIKNAGPNVFYNNTLSGNISKNGGGLCVLGNDETALGVYNSTISNNLAGAWGGGIYNGYSGWWGTASTLRMGNTLLAGNTANGLDQNPGNELYEPNDDLSIAFVSDGYNLLGENGDPGFRKAVLAGRDLILAGPIETAIEPLADNGGPTQTHLPVDGPATDSGSNALVPTDALLDQRGETRISNGTVDIGSVELVVGGVCDEYPVVVPARTYGGLWIFQSWDDVSTQGDVIVPSDGDVRFEAGLSISLKAGFKVQAGARFRAEIKPVSCG